jgi:hypothetical protein
MNSKMFFLPSFCALTWFCFGVSPALASKNPLRRTASSPDLLTHSPLVKEELTSSVVPPPPSILQRTASTPPPSIPDDSPVPEADSTTPSTPPPSIPDDSPAPEADSTTPSTPPRAASAPPPSIPRISSIPHFPAMEDKFDLGSYSVKECKEFFEEHFPGEPFADLAHRTRGPESLPMNALKDIILFKAVTTRGFKFKKRLIGSKEIYVVDISWPEIKRIAQKKLESVESCSEFNQEHITWENVKYIFERMAPVEESLMRGDYQINAEDVNFLERVFFDEGKFFRIGMITPEAEAEARELNTSPYGFREEDARKIKEMFKNMLKNATGYQRIMSLLGVQVVRGSCRTLLERKIVRGASWGSTLEGISIPKDFLATQLVFEHELSHQVHNFIGPVPLAEEAYGSVGHIYSVLNSGCPELIYFYYPMLKDMYLYMEEIKYMFDRFYSDTIEEYAQYYNSKNDKLIAILDALFAEFARQGILKNFFPHFNKNYSEWLDKREITQAIFLRLCLYYRGSLWTNREEMLTITGFALFKIGDKLFALEDRQNEEIYKIRRLSNKVVFPNFYRFHYTKEARSAILCEKDPFCEEDGICFFFRRCIHDFILLREEMVKTKPSICRFSSSVPQSNDSNEEQDPSVHEEIVEVLRQELASVYELLSEEERNFARSKQLSYISPPLL